MASRRRDLVIATAAAVVATPVCLAAAIGIWLSDGGPVLHRARRVGLHGRVFTMFKLRTMRSGDASKALVTADGDARVFRFGAWLRRWKIDELPQLINVIRGEMAIVGPRPEDPDIVARCYGALARETLTVPPGLASPGSIFHFTHGEQQLGPADADAIYMRRVLPQKLALDLVYVRHASSGYDLRVMARAAAAILGRGAGRRSFPDPPEMRQALQLERVLQSGACETVTLL